MKRPGGSARCLQLESLEQRELMAGNVWVGLDQGLLRVVGDDLPNEVSITPTRRAGEFEVRGNSGTSINGRQSVKVSGVTQGVQVLLNGGDDRLVVHRGSTSNRDVIPGPFGLGIDAGAGNDAVFVENIRVEHSSGISMQAGNDRVEVVNSYFGWDLIIDTGSGGDDVAVKNGTTAAHFMMIGTGQGNDRIRFDRAGAAWVYVEAGTGSDLLTVKYLHSALPPGFDLGPDYDPYPEFVGNYYPFHYLVGEY